MNIRFLGGFYLKNDVGTVVASIQYVDSASYPDPVIEIASAIDGVGIVITNANSSMVDDHGDISVPSEVDYFPFA